MLENSSALVKRIYDVSQEMFSFTQRKGQVSGEIYTSMHEMQLIFLQLLIPHFIPITEFHSDTKVDFHESEIKVGDFILMCINKFLRDSRQFLAYFMSLNIYQNTALNYQHDISLLTPLDFSKKTTVLAALQIVNTVITQNASGSLAEQLKDSGDVLSKKFSKEMAHSNNPSGESFVGQARAEAINTVLGSANDGISHLVAAVDIYWDTHQSESIKSRINKAMKGVRFIMEKYLSWQIQLLDIMLLANKNPYEVASNNELVETGLTKEILSWGEKLALQGFIPFSKYPEVLNSFLKRMGKTPNEIELAVAICEALIAILGKKTDPLSGASMYMSYLTKDKEYLVDLVSQNNSIDRNTKRKIISKKDKVQLVEALQLAQIPAKVSLIIVRSQNENPSRKPKCALLTVNQGLGNWITSLTDTLTTLEQYNVDSLS